MPVDLSTLNEGQLAAVRAPLDRPTLVIAGAGSGKTTTLTARLEHVVSTGVDPANVVAMTFTRKAAGEFADRLAGGPAVGVWSGTIHSFAWRRYKAWLLATGQDVPQVLTNPKWTVKNLVGRKTEDYPEAVDGPELDLSTVLAAIDTWQNELVDPVEAGEIADGWVEEWCARIYQAYTKWKRRTGHIDFGDMLGLCIDAYESDEAFLAGDRAQFPYGLVDELQDTNTAQWRLAHLVWSDRPLFGVGDPRQAIYQWRGARPDQLLAFADLWPGTEVVKLVDNYRSTPQIVDAAETLMSRTPEATASGRLRPNRGDGPAPELVTVSDHTEEAALVASLVGELRRTGKVTRLGECAVLYRTNAQSVDFEDELSRAEIPYQVVGSKGFWARSEVRQLLAYLELASDHDDIEAFTTALMAPSRYLGKAFVAAAAAIASDRSWSLVEACAHVTGYNGRALNRGQADEASHFTALIRSLSGLEPAKAIERVLRVTDFKAWLKRNDGSSDGADDDKNDVLAKLVDQAAAFSTYEGLLEHAEKMRSKASAGSKPDPDRVQLLTIHRAKGLEWPAVFVAGFSEGLLPHHRGNPEEERRLAYVAMTRARDRLWLLSPRETYRGPTGVSEFAVDAGLATPTEAAVGL